jgi:hypothetical protein
MIEQHESFWTAVSAFMDRRSLRERSRGCASGLEEARGNYTVARLFNMEARDYSDS